MLALTKVMLSSIGIAALLISALIFVIDSHSTANVFSSIFAFAFGEVGNSGGLVHVNVDTSKLTELEAEQELLKVEIGQCEAQATVIPTNNIVRSIGQRSGNSLMGWTTLRSV